MFYDQYSKYDTSFGLDNNYFEVDFSMDDYLDLNKIISDVESQTKVIYTPTQKTPLPSSADALKDDQTLVAVSKFTDGSTPPNEGALHDDNSLILKSLPNNKDYDVENKTTDQYIYSDYDKHGNIKRIEPYVSPNSILNKKSRFSNYDDWVIMTWNDILLIINIFITFLLVLYLYKTTKKIKKLKQLITKR